MRDSEISQAMLCLRGSDLAFFETENAMLHIVDGRVALLEVKRGRAIDRNQSKFCLDLLERFLGSKYSIVVNRNVNEVSQYHGIYEAIEGRRLLSKIAIIWDNLGVDCREYGAAVCKKKMSVFTNVDDAISWARAVS